jgi:hypothetical protein
MSEELLRLKTKRIKELEAENARLKKSAREDMEEFDAVTARCIETLGDDAPDFGTSLPYVDLICARLLAQTTKPEPSRLEIALAFAVADYAAFSVKAQDGGPTIDEFYPWPKDFRGVLETADALIAAAKAVQP